MRHFVVKIILFGFLIFGCYYLLDSMVTKGLRKNTSNVYEVWNEIYNGGIDPDIIINGSSIAEVQINPKILDTILHVNSYNFGMSGFGFPMQYARYNVYKKQNKKRPKYVIQIVGDGLFEEFDELFQTTQFLPYIKDTILSKETKNYKGLDYFDYVLPFKRYSAKYKTILKGFFSFAGIEFLNSQRYKGYTPNEFEWDYKFDEFKEKNPKGKKRKIKEESVRLLETFIKEEYNNKTEVILVFPPTYHELKKYMLNREVVLNEYKRISNKYNIHFLDYSDTDISSDKNLFYNASHMNKKGANLFTKQLAKDLKALKF